MTCDWRLCRAAGRDGIPAVGASLRVFVVEQDCPYLDLDGRDTDPSARHLWVEGGGVPVATLRLLSEEGVLRIGRVATVAEHRGSGLAAALVDAALALAGERDVVLAPSHTWSTGTPGSGSSPVGAVPGGRDPSYAVATEGPRPTR